jgi:hypothetical protein
MAINAISINIKGTLHLRFHVSAIILLAESIFVGGNEPLSIYGSVIFQFV